MIFRRSPSNGCALSRGQAPVRFGGAKEGDVRHIENSWLPASAEQRTAPEGSQQINGVPAESRAPHLDLSVYFIGFG
jgi:hypothetical protein